jgi:DNA-binding LytR/AlgR family response regulator
MKVVIIEEEEMVARRLGEAIGRMQADLKKVDTVPDFCNFLRYLKKNDEPDLLLLDVFQLNQKVVRFFQSGNFAFPVLFTNSLKTAGFTLPVVSETKAVNDITFPLFTSHSSVALSQPLPNYQERFLVKNKQKLVSIRAEEVSLFFAEGRLNFLKTKDKRKFIIHYTMEALSHSLLEPKCFFRVNRSTIVSFNDIKEMFPYFGGRIKLALHTPYEKDIIVSRDKVNEFKKWLGE